MNKQDFSTTTLTPAEALSLADAYTDASPSGIRNRSILALFWRYGLTSREIIELRVEDYDGRDSTLRVGDLRKGTRRRLKLDLESVMRLELWLAERRKLRRKFKVLTDGPMFGTIESNNFGKPLGRGYVLSIPQRAAARVGIDRSRISAECFRDALCAERLKAGFSRIAIAELLGEARAKTFLKPRYGEYPLDAFDASSLGRRWQANSDRITYELGGRMTEVVEEGDQEQQIIDVWQPKTAFSNGSVSSEKAKHERVVSSPAESSTSELQALESRVKSLESQIAELTALVKRLVKDPEGD